MRSILSLARTFALTSSVAVFAQPNPAQAQSLVGSQQFQELFTSAGYSALFGAALGTAVLPFVPDNSVSSLRIVAGGASLGFVLGSVMSLYGLRQQQHQQAFGMPYYQDTDAAAGDGTDWRWDLGTSSGKDVFVRMDSRF
ncbi:MAG: hypothetical protein FJY29_11910 [Betaproteobacteria bacterium]|nr:hypothetical protein [Betaproteobacteria bacterium]